MSGAWQEIDLEEDNAQTGIGHVVWFLLEAGYVDAAGAVEDEFGVVI